MKIIIKKSQKVNVVEIYFIHLIYQNYYIYIVYNINKILYKLKYV